MLESYQAKSGTFEPVWTLEIQTLPEDTDRILDAVLAVHPLGYGRYHRNASISAVGKETARPQPNSTTVAHKLGYEADATETYPMVELKISIERDLPTLQRVNERDPSHAPLRTAGDFPARGLGQPVCLRPAQQQSESLVDNGRGLPAH